MSLTPSRFRLVIVDDNPSDIVLLQEAIDESQHPIDAITFTSAAQALKALPGLGPVDLILSDVNMPLMNGSDFIARLRSDPRFGNTVFVLMSSAIDQDMPVAVRPRCGDVAYIRKGSTWVDYRIILDALHQRMVVRRMTSEGRAR